MQNDPIHKLSRRQIDLLALVAKGITASKRLADQTGLQPGYIDNCLSNAARILGVRDRVSAAKLVSRHLQENSHLASHMRTYALETGSEAEFRDEAKPESARVAGLWGRFHSLVTGIPLGGFHDFGWQRIFAESFKVAFLSLIALFVLVLFVLGFIQTFS